MKKQKKKIRVLTYIILILLILLFVLILINFNFLRSSKLNPEKILIEDKCATILNNLIHQIRNENDCRMICKAECEVRKKEFSRSNFLQKENSCNICECYCN